ncbi:MAG: hypothetical protein K2Q97_06525, partial [Burkholderiaceae bacterium]|nr:hypothetical protein [Burkholderiaceae bacterium]
ITSLDKVFQGLALAHCEVCASVHSDAFRNVRKHRAPHRFLAVEKAHGLRRRPEHAGQQDFQGVAHPWEYLAQRAVYQTLAETEFDPDGR